MKLKIYDYIKNPSKNSKPIGEVIIKHKELIKTISIDKHYTTNNKTLDSKNRTKYNLIFLDKYRDEYKYGKIFIRYDIRQGNSFAAYIRPNIFKEIYLKLLFEYYYIQKIKSLKSFFIGVITGVLVTVISKVILKYLI